jgi:hypothetical protein
MKERPILFSAPMVRAILEGRKTQTRRVVKWVPSPRGNFKTVRLTGTNEYVLLDDDRGLTWTPYSGSGEQLWPVERYRDACPYGGPGDRLWVRETWQALRFVEAMSEGYSLGYCDDRYAPDKIPKSNENGFWKPVYAATDPFGEEPTSEERGFSWRPAIHMPRWASRLALDVIRIRVERLQDITEEDARAEGVTFGEPQPAIINGERGEVCFFNARDAFAYLWAAINGADSWKANPWVWVVDFNDVEAQARSAA